MKAICVIPAKGTSKRLPGKNIKPFHGKPVIEYTIEAAVKSGVFDEVWVSTRNGKTAKIAIGVGAIPFFRSPDTEEDDTPMVDAVIEVLEMHPADYVCMAYACSPFIEAERIKQAHYLLGSGDFDCVFPVYRAEPSERTLILSGGRFISRYPEYDNVNSQHFPFSYHSAGQFYFCNAEMVATFETVMLPRMWGIEIPRWEAVDIDTADDWLRAEMLWGVK